MCLVKVTSAGAAACSPLAATGAELRPAPSQRAAAPAHIHPRARLLVIGRSLGRPPVPEGIRQPPDFP